MRGWRGLKTCPAGSSSNSQSWNWADPVDKTTIGNYDDEFPKVFGKSHGYPRLQCPFFSVFSER